MRRLAEQIKGTGESLEHPQRSDWNRQFKKNSTNWLEIKRALSLTRTNVSFGQPLTRERRISENSAKYFLQ